MAFPSFVRIWARRLPADVRRCHHTEAPLRFMSQLTRLDNSLHSPATIPPLTRTRRPRTLQSLSSAAQALVLRSSLSSLAAGGHQNDPIHPPKMEPAPIENPRFGEEGAGMNSDERRTIPEELSRNVLVLTCDSVDGGTCHVYLVGTCHISQESCREVEAVISYIKPQVVFLELCQSRKTMLTRQDLKVPTMSEMIDRWKKKQHPFGIVYSWFLAKASDNLDVIPGSEFRVGYEEAKKCGSKVVLGDRPVNVARTWYEYFTRQLGMCLSEQVTLQRTWRKMPLWHKAQLLCSFFVGPFLFQRLASCKGSLISFSSDTGTNLNRLSSAEVDELIQEMGKLFPTLHETIVDERDQYMASTLLRVARHHHSVVAVVGKAHLPGIKKYWLQPVDMDKLMEIP